MCLSLAKVPSKEEFVAMVQESDPSVVDNAAARAQSQKNREEARIKQVSQLSLVGMGSDDCSERYECS